MIRATSIQLIIMLGVMSFLSVCFSGSVTGQDDPEQLEEAAIGQAVSKVEGSVIRFETIGGNSRVEGVVVANGPSTGVAVSKDGYVISASFHFAHQPASILARLPNGKTAAAEIVGRDLSRKIVLLKIQSDFEFDVPQMMQANDLQVGQTVIAIGRVMDSASPNVSTGIVSAKDRVWGKAIQTDAKISPANFGGPLTDLRGQVAGILVPMSPDDDGEMAGTRWYDSGIGFAVPITDLMERIEDLKSGEPLRAGLMGASFKGTDLYVDKAVVAFCAGTSPAGKAGIRTGDEIVEINGISITRQSQLKHALGPLYENDKINIKVVRNEKEIPFTFELAGELEPYQPPGIGITFGAQTLVIDRVLGGSPADKAGLKIGDLIRSFNDNAIEDVEDLRSELASATIGDSVDVAVERDGDLKKMKLTVRSRSAELFPVEEIQTDRKARSFEIKVADAANHCFALAPTMLEGETPPALLVWISNPGKLDRKNLEKRWLSHCQNHNITILFPESTDEKKWSPDDASFIISAIKNLNKQSRFDSKRVTIGGLKTGGTMVSLIAFGRREMFQGLVMIDAKLSTRISQTQTSPAEPLLIFAGTSEVDLAFQSSVDQLKEAHFPVYVKEKKADQSFWIEMLVPWTKTVNRL